MPDRKLQVGGPPKISSDSDTAWAGTIAVTGGSDAEVTGLNTYIHNANTLYLVAPHNGNAVDGESAWIRSTNNGTLTITPGPTADAQIYRWWAFQGGTALTAT